MKRIIACFVLPAVVILNPGATSASGQEPDTIAESLRLTPAHKALPVWERPDANARRMLGGLARSNSRAILFVGQPEKGHGTAWVLSRKHRLLVTNAHVADIMHPEGEMLAIVNGTSQVYTVQRAWYHPGVRRYVKKGGRLSIRSADPRDGKVDPLSPDIAVVELSDEGPMLPAELKLATPEELKSLFAQPVGMLGFPGHDTRKWPALGRKVQATYHDGVVSRLTDFRLGADAPAGELQFLQYTIGSWGGFSGSPVFNVEGHVVGVHNSARYVSSRRVQTFTVQIPHGVRIDCLWELLVHHRLDGKVALKIDKSQLRIDRWLRRDPRDEDLRRAVDLVEAAEVLRFKQKYTEAVEKCNEAARIAPDYPRLYEVRSKAYEDYKHFHKVSAEERRRLNEYVRKGHKKHASLVGASSPRAIINVGFDLYHSGTLTKRKAYYRQSLELMNRLLESGNMTDSNRGSAHSCRGCCYHNLGYTDLALDEFNRSVRVDPNNDASLDNRAMHWDAVRRPDLARADRAKAKEIRQKRLAELKKKGN